MNASNRASLNFDDKIEHVQWQNRTAVHESKIQLTKSNNRFNLWMHQIEQGRISKEVRCRKVIGARKSIGAHERFWRIIRYFPCILLARARESTEDSEHRHHHSLASCSDTTLVLSAAAGRPCCWRRRASYQPDAAAIEERGSGRGAGGCRQHKERAHL